MGGGNSKLNAGEAAAVPAKIRPVLHRRFEELRKGRSAARLQVEGTLSKKQLLKDAEEEEDSNSHSSHETKTEDKVSTKVIQLAKEETGVRVIATEKLSRVVPLPNSECEVEEEKDSNKGNVEQDNKHNDHDDQENVDDSTKSNVEQDNKHNDHDDQGKVKESNKDNVEQDNKHNDHDDQEKVKESNKSNVEQDNEHNDHDDREKVKDTNKSNVEQDNKHNDHDDQKKVIHVDEKAEAEVKIEKEEATLPEPDKEQDVDDDDESEQFGMFLRGSPSFRIYCIEAEKGQEEETKKQTIAMHQKSCSADSLVSATSQLENSGNLNEVIPVAEIEPTTKRKGNKAKKFGAVRTLLKVKSCYHPMCSCTGDERRHLIAAKAAN